MRFNPFKKKLSERDQRLVDLYEMGLYLQVDNGVDNKKMIEEAYAKPQPAPQPIPQPVPVQNVQPVQPVQNVPVQPQPQPQVQQPIPQPQPKPEPPKKVYKKLKDFQEESYYVQPKS